MLAEWESGVFTSVRPAALMPFGGLFQTITWSRGRAEKMHTELTGMSTASSVGDINFGDKAKRLPAATPQPKTVYVEAKKGTKVAPQRQGEAEA